MSKGRLPTFSGPSQAHEASGTCTKIRLGFECGKPAAIHVLWTIDNTSGLVSRHGYACAEHATAALAYRNEDHHPFGGACGIPGSVWSFSSETPDDVGACIIPLAESEEAAAEQSTALPLK